MDCPKCGTQLEPGTTVCPTCQKAETERNTSPEHTKRAYPKSSGGALTLCKFNGRAKRKAYWITFFIYLLFLTISLILFSVGIPYVGDSPGWILVFIVLALLFIILTINFIGVSVRRLHDLGMSGFWLMYLNILGLPVIYLVYLLDLDSSCNRVIEKVQSNSHPWLSWIITTLFWWIGAPLSLLLLFMYEGKHEDNEFGPSPY